MRADEQPLLNQIGFINFLERICLLAQRGPQIVETHRPAAKLVDQGFQQPPIHFVQALGIHAQ